MKKQTVIKLLALSMALIATLALAGCGNKDAEEETYTAVTEPTFAPFDTTDDDGNIVGFDMDLLDAIAKDQGFKVKYKSLEFDALIPALESKQGDIIAAAMNSDDPDRQAKVDFSDSYYKSGLTVLVKKDNTTITGVDSFTSDMKVVGQIGTTGADKANELEKSGKIGKAVILNKYTDAVQQLENGDVDAVIIDVPVADEFINKQPDKVKKVGDVLNAEHYAFAVQKGDSELQEKINKGLKNVKEDGTYDKLYKKWFK